MALRFYALLPTVLIMKSSPLACSGEPSLANSQPTCADVAIV